MPKISKQSKTVATARTSAFSEATFQEICDTFPGIVAVFNVNSGKFAYVNQGISTLLGYPVADLLKGGITFATSLIHPDDLHDIATQNLVALDAANKQSNEGSSSKNLSASDYRMRHAEGHYVWLQANSSVLTRKNGKVEHVLNVAIDASGLSNVADRKKAEQQLRASEERYQAFIRNSNEAIWRCELDEPIPTNLPVAEQIKRIYEYGYLAEANQTMSTMYGFDAAQDLSGTRLSDLLVASDPSNTAYLTAFIQSDYKLSGAESHETDSRGNDKYFMNSLVGVVENRKLVRAWGTQQDITKERAANEALRKSEERLEKALDASRLGMWEWDIVNQKLVWSEQLKKLFGLNASDEITYERYQTLIAPEHRPHMKKTIQEALKTGKHYQFEHEVVWPDGSKHWLLGQGKATLKDGTAIRMTGTSINIDDYKNAVK